MKTGRSTEEKTQLRGVFHGDQSWGCAGGSAWCGSSIFWPGLIEKISGFPESQLIWSNPLSLSSKLTFSTSAVQLPTIPHSPAFSWPWELYKPVIAHEELLCYIWGLCSIWKPEIFSPLVRGKHSENLAQDSPCQPLHPQSCLYSHFSSASCRIYSLHMPLGDCSQAVVCCRVQPACA